ncbi:hypothetical protein CEXT_325491 [Caerostris extrusa]|uniref:Uncharacterized protein n=1 Tax=Caerostris extrusa TaxID=172846 RepID=A0AAV4V1E3_CAEEX|nr:hypothetical protein CEXT_325491 [Caerostris extrusa]
MGQMDEKIREKQLFFSGKRDKREIMGRGSRNDIFSRNRDEKLLFQYSADASSLMQMARHQKDVKYPFMSTEKDVLEAGKECQMM